MILEDVWTSGCFTLFLSRTNSLNCSKWLKPCTWCDRWAGLETLLNSGPRRELGEFKESRDPVYGPQTISTIYVVSPVHVLLLNRIILGLPFFLFNSEVRDRILLHLSLKTWGIKKVILARPVVPLLMVSYGFFVPPNPGEMFFNRLPLRPALCLQLTDLIPREVQNSQALQG